MKKLWLRIREATVRKMIRLGFDPDVILVRSTELLVDENGKVESPLYYDAVRYVVERKFCGVSDEELAKIGGTYAKLERLRRAE